ncbi:MAG: mycobacterial-type methylenetetrahydrofolate reductase [Pseudonocardiaceae bacterium]
MTLNTIALELVPPNVEDGKERAVEEAHKVLEHSKMFGIEGRIGHVLIPVLIEERSSR